MAKTSAQPKPKSPAPCWKDRRLYARNHVIWNGRLRGGVAEQDCVILDLSASGAMVRLSDPSPSAAGITVSTEQMGELQGRVVWQFHNVVGVAFADRPQQVARVVEAAAPHLRLAS